MLLLSTKVVEGVEAAGQCFSKYHAGAFRGEEGGGGLSTRK